LNVLVIDDDDAFREFLTLALREEGHEPTAASSAEAGKAVLEERPTEFFDVILLDVEMPGASGWDVLMGLREVGDETPVIFVTGREAVEERVKGLRMGADDYVVKPFEIAELLARMEAAVRARRALTRLRFGDLVVDQARRKVHRGEMQVDLSPREYDLLHALIEARGELVTREKLLQQVWDMRFDPGTNVLDVHIGRVRRKLDRHGPPLIQTVRGKGYKLLMHAAEEG
jgi:DNA-binding response OmpR family regulator